MIETTVSLGKLIAGVLWTCTGLLIAAAWAVTLLADHRTGLLLGATAGVVAMTAMVATVRTYMVRMSKLIRVMADPGPDRSGLRSMR